MSNTPAKKTVAKRAAKKATPRNPKDTPKVIDADGVEDTSEAAGDAVIAGHVPMPLYRGGEPTGRHRNVPVRRPTETQMVVFEATAHRFNLAMEAWQDGTTFDADGRGELFNDLLQAMNIFVATRYDRKWVASAMAEGIVELAGVMEFIENAKTTLGLDVDGEAAAADVTVERE